MCQTVESGRACAGIGDGSSVTLTAVLNLAWAANFLAGQDEWMPWPERVILLLAGIDVLIIVGVWRSPLYAQLFREFPTARTVQGSPP